MDVAIVTTWESECGIATYSAQLSKALTDAGHRVTILAEIHELGHAGQGRVFRLWDRRSAYEAPYGLGTVVKAVLSSPKRPDVIHVQHEFGLFPHDPSFFRFVRELKAVTKVVITLHTVTPPPKCAGFFKAVRQLEALRVPLIVHSLEGAAALEGWGTRARLVPHGVEIRERRSGGRVERLLLCPGFMGKSKGQLEIIEALGLMEAYYVNNFRAVFAGRCRDTAYLQLLQSAVREYGLNDHVSIREEFYTDEELHEMFSRASVVVLGSGKSTPYSSSGQLHMAYGHGLPVLAKNVPIYRDRGGAMYYNTPEECAFLLHGMFRSEDVQERLAAQSREIALDRTWEKTAKHHSDVYEA